ncbi:hypothetical protein SAMN04487939_11284 [Lysobacter sp. yr284]|uniref:hypothetical protein n=1 Tax=Lysobacter sp. yr284 TaxID=1761791 RepID=UPI00089545B8|nr:hypothetical protein [Lysobacter sp. yr284]SDZ02520.1 hypothetical protein SAMN04487939_11284 [Lysobacter sp. yr284]
MRKMKSNRFSLSRCVAALVLAGACAAASAAGEPQPFDAAAVLAQQKQIRSDVEAGRGDYARLDPAQREELRTRQDRLDLVLQGRGYDQLSAAEREQAQQDLQWIRQAGGTASVPTASVPAAPAAPVAAAAQPEEKVRCERVRAIGSNRTERVCTTASQRHEAQKNRVEPQLDRAGAR